MPGVGAQNPPTTGTTAVSNLTLGNGQRAILTTIKNGGNLTGTLQIVPTPIAGARQSAALPFQFAFGSYTITGTVSNSGAFSISGNFGAQGAFSMTGQLQSATQDGNYTLKVNGQTDMGILPKTGKPFPGVTPQPPVGGNLTGNLVYSAVTAGEVVSTPITGFGGATSGALVTINEPSPFSGKAQTLTLNGETVKLNGNGQSRTIGLVLSSSTPEEIIAGKNKVFSVGQEIEFLDTNRASDLLQYSQSKIQGTAVSLAVWRATSGKVIIRAIGTNSATVELKNVRVDPSPIFGGVGSFTLNGTLTATGLTTKTQ